MMRFCLRPTQNPARVAPFVEEARPLYATIPKRTLVPSNYPPAVWRSRR
jgi:hypothetical protein